MSSSRNIANIKGFQGPQGELGSTDISTLPSSGTSISDSIVFEQSGSYYTMPDYGLRRLQRSGPVLQVESQAGTIGETGTFFTENIIVESYIDESDDQVYHTLDFEFLATNITADNNGQYAYVDIEVDPSPLFSLAQVASSAPMGVESGTWIGSGTAFFTTAGGGTLKFTAYVPQHSTIPASGTTNSNINLRGRLKVVRVFLNSPIFS